MKTKLVLVLLILSLGATATAQTRMSVGATVGTRIHPSDSQLSPMGGVSAWYHMAKKISWSGEYLLYDGVDDYSIPAGYIGTAVSTDNNLTQRLSLGLHYPILTRGSKNRDLIGLHFGQSWEKRNFSLIAKRLNNSGEAVTVTVTENTQRSLWFASWTALGQLGNFPFFVQARYGYTFAGGSLWSMEDSQSFLQAALGVHLKLL